MEKKRKTREKWTFEKCQEKAKVCKTTGEFKKLSLHAYEAARRHEWIDKFNWLERVENPFIEDKDNVYAYFFEDHNAVYVGRTINIERRDSEHKCRKDTVSKFAFKNNISIPDMTILESNLSLIEGLEKEDFYVNKYRQEGWIILNCGKTGVKSGSLGSLSRKWNKKTCLEEAKKYNLLNDFSTKSRVAYIVSKGKGWLEDYTWLERQCNRAILQYAFDGTLIKEYKTAGEIENNFNYIAINKCCNGKRIQYKGFFWCYKGEENKITEKMKNFIFKYDNSFNLLTVYRSIRQAAKEKNTSSEYIIIGRYIDKGIQAPDGYYYFHGPHEFTDEEKELVGLSTNKI